MSAVAEFGLWVARVIGAFMFMAGSGLAVAVLAALIVVGSLFLVAGLAVALLVCGGLALTEKAE